MDRHASDVTKVANKYKIIIDIPNIESDTEYLPEGILLPIYVNNTPIKNMLINKIRVE